MAARVTMNRIRIYRLNDCILCLFIVYLHTNAKQFQYDFQKTSTYFLLMRAKLHFAGISIALTISSLRMTCRYYWSDSFLSKIVQKKKDNSIRFLQPRTLRQARKMIEIWFDHGQRSLTPVTHAREPRVAYEQQWRCGHFHNLAFSAFLMTSNDSDNDLFHSFVLSRSAQLPRGDLFFEF